MDPLPSTATEEVLAGDRVMGTEEDAEQNMNIEEEISKLLSTEAVSEDKRLRVPSTDYKADDIDLNASPVKETSLSEDSFQAEGLDNLEAAKVKEAALDDKLSIELRGIVQQIQVQENRLKTSIFCSFEGHAKRSCCCLARRRRRNIKLVKYL